MLTTTVEEVQRCGAVGPVDGHERCELVACHDGDHAVAVVRGARSVWDRVRRVPVTVLEAGFGNEYEIPACCWDDSDVKSGDLGQARLVAYFEDGLVGVEVGVASTDRGEVLGGICLFGPPGEFVDQLRAAADAVEALARAAGAEQLLWPG